MAAHRFWRVRFQPVSGNWGGCSILELRSVAGGPSVALGGVAIASSIASATYDAAKAFDGLTTTRWSSTNAAQDWWIGYDFGLDNEVEINEVMWRPNQEGLASSPRYAELQYSDDGIAWEQWLDTIPSMPNWTLGEQRVWTYVNSSLKTGGLLAQGHTSFNPNACISGIVASLHHRGSLPYARVSGVAIGVHTNLGVLSNGRVGGLLVQIHVGLNQRPTPIIPIPANSTITEKLEWQTDIIEAYDGSENRISVRMGPRRNIGYEMSLLDDEDRKKLFDVYWQIGARWFNAPILAYQGYVKQPAPSGSNTIFTNTARADIRDKEEFVVVHPNRLQEVYTAQTVLADRIIVGRGVVTAIPVGAIVSPCPVAYPQANSEISMSALSGSSTLNADIQYPRTQLKWPLSEVELDSFDGIVWLKRRPLAEQGVETFMSNVEKIDNETGLPAYYTSWDFKQIEGRRVFLINSLFNLNDLHYWQAFLDYCNGQQKTFLISTYRSDQVGVTMDGSSLVVEGDSYNRFYKGDSKFKRLEIETDKGLFQVVVQSASYSNGRTTIIFRNPIAGDFEQVKIKRVSYLLLARLGSDTVTLTHVNNFIKVDLAIRTVKE